MKKHEHPGVQNNPLTERSAGSEFTVGSPPINQPSLVGANRRGSRWEFFAPRLQNRVVAASSLEFSHYVMLESDPDIASYEVQVKKPIELDGKVRTVIFSSMAVYRDQSVVVNDVKYSTQLSSPPAQNQLTVHRAWAAMNGVEHRLLTEVQIRGAAIYLENCHLVLSWTQPLYEMVSQTRSMVVGTIASCDHAMTLNEVAAASKQSIEAVAAIVASEYVNGRLALPEFRQKKFGRLSTVRRIF